MSMPPQPPPSFSATWASVDLDLLRGLAAILVLVDHWRNLFFVQFHALGAHRSFFAVPYVLTAAGHQAVVIFFVLSGFLIGGTIRHAFDRGQWSWASYLTHRFVRLWVVLLPGLMLCLLWDKMSDSGGTDTATTFIGNMFFVQGVIVPAFGSDGPLWSIANEFWYYVLFPLGFVAVLPSTRPRTRLITAALFLLLCLWLRTTLLPLFPIWLLGAIVLIVPRPRLSSARRWAAVTTYAPIVFLCTYVQTISIAVADCILAAATATLIWVLLSASQATPAASGRVRFSRGLARFSYTLYVVHFPLLTLIAGLLVGKERWLPTPLHIAAALGILSVTLAYAYGIASLTEFHTGAVRNWAEQRLGLPSARRSAPTR